MFAGLMRISEWVAKMASAHMLWLLMTAPFYTCVWLAIHAPAVRVLAVGIAVVCAVLLLIPATVALFGVVRPWVMGHTDTGVWRMFWHTWRALYVRSIGLGMLASVAGAVAYAAWVTYGAATGWVHALRIVVVVAVVVGVLGVVHTMCFFVHFRHAFWQSVISGVLFAFVQPWTTLVSVVVGAIVVHASIVWPGLALFFSASVVVLVIFYQYERAIRAMRIVSQNDVGGA